MKNFNEKIAKFLKWTEEEKWPIINEELFNLYCMENPDIEPLTDEERKYLITLSKLRTQKMWSTGVIKGDAAKLTMVNEWGWSSEKSKQEISNEIEYVTISTEGLLTEPTNMVAYENLDLKNEAVEKMLKEIKN